MNTDIQNQFEQLKTTVLEEREQHKQEREQYQKEQEEMRAQIALLRYFENL